MVYDERSKAISLEDSINGMHKWNLNQVQSKNNWNRKP